MKITNEKGITLIIIIIIAFVVVVGLVIFSTVNQSSSSNEKLLKEINNIATQIQREKANLKESIGKNVTTEETIAYLEKLNIIDSENNILSDEVENLKLLLNGIITHNGEKIGQVLLTDF